MIRRSAFALVALSCVLSACKKKSSTPAGGGAGSGSGSSTSTSTGSGSGSGGGSGSGSGATAPSPAADDKDCAAAIDTFSKSQDATMKEFFAEVKKSGSDEDKAQAAKAEAELAKAAPRLRTILMARCVSDKWSADLLKCVREAQAKNASTCEAMFTPEQKQRIQNDLVAAGLAPKPAAAAAGGSCDDVVAHIEALMMADAKTPEEKESMAPMVEPLTRIMREQCAASAWSAELRGCLGAAPELPAMEKCDPLFTPAQKAALDHAIGGDANKKQPE